MVLAAHWARSSCVYLGFRVGRARQLRQIFFPPGLGQPISRAARLLVARQPTWPPVDISDGAASKVKTGDHWEVVRKPRH